MGLIALSLSWIGGVVLGERMGWWPLIFSGAGLGLLLLGYGWRRRRVWLLLGLGLLVLGAGVGRGAWGRAEEPPLSAYTGEEHRLYGEVSQVGGWGRGMRLHLKVWALRAGESWTPVRGPAFLYLSPLAHYQVGDRVVAQGPLEPPRKRGAAPAMFYPRVWLVGRGEGFPGAVAEVREGLYSGLRRSLPEPQGALAGALVLGLRGELPQEVNQAFRLSGTFHLLAISGMHIAVFAGMVLSGAAWALGRHRPYYLLLALLLVWLYVLLSGLQPPAVRAGIMASLFFYGEWLGRPRASLTALCFAAALMVGLSPSVLEEISFQLSFTAMAGLILLSPPLQGWGQRLPLPRPVVDSLAYSVGAVAATLPLVAYYFSYVSYGSLPATLLALPALPGAVVASGLTAVLGWGLPMLAHPVSWVAWPFLSYTLWVAKTFGSLPGVSRTLTLSPFEVWGAYSALGGLLLLRLPAFRRGVWGAMKRLVADAAAWYPRLPLRGMALSLLLTSALVWASLLSLPDPRFQVIFLDVGQGQAILLQQGSRQVLIDGGPSPSRLLLTLSRQMPFWDRSLDGVVLTHPHGDHIGGLYEVVRRYQVGRAMAPPWATSPALEQWEKLLQQRGVPPLPPTPGLRLRLGDGVLEVLHPEPTLLQGTESDEDNNSLVLRLEVGGVSFLFTADIQREGEGELLRQGLKLRSTVLQVAHHGSHTSTTPRFLQAVAPYVAVISSGEGYPHPSVMERLKERLGKDRIYLTSKNGTIRLITDGQRLWIKTDK